MSRPCLQVPDPSSNSEQAVLSCAVPVMKVKDKHAHLQRQPCGKYTIEDLATSSGTWLNGRKIGAGQQHTLLPGDELAFGAKQGEGITYRVKMVHASVWDQLNNGQASARAEGSEGLAPSIETTAREARREEHVDSVDSLIHV